jgi:pimeloyl-ACP methyl ester carboxylesterase
MHTPPLRPTLLALALAALLGAVAVLGGQPASAGGAVTMQSEFAGLVDIGGGRRMYLECRGQGSPTVVLVSGYGNHGGVWSVDSPEVPQPQVMPAVAGFTRVCAYDRPGTVGLDLDDPADRSRSDPVPQPSTAAAAVADLHALLHAAAVPGPYVLAGHSLGGLYARLYAATYPDEVAGMVLVDAMSERFRAVLTPEQWAAAVELFQSPSLLPQLASWREYERIDFDVVFDEMLRATAARPLRQMPLIVLSAGFVPDVSELGLDLPPGFQETLTAAARANQAFQAMLLPDSRQVIVAEAGHYIQLEQPQAVIDAVRQVVEAVRDPAAATPAAAGGVPGQITWRACPTDELPARECGELAVPLSYREPQGATIALAVGRVPATDPAGRIGSLFLNPGGPGQPGFEELPIMYAPLPEPIRRRFDIVGFDPRGVGESAPVRCFDSPEEQAAFFAGVPRVPVGAAEEAALLRSSQELGRRCGERNAAILPHLSTFNVAQDLDRLRQAVGDERLNYWGVSYGTYLGATYANLFPDRVRAIVLDGVINPPSYTSFDHGDGDIVGPDTNSFLRVLSNRGSEDTFGQFIDLCAAAGVARCAFAAPSAAETRAKFDALMARLRAQPAILMGPAGTLTVTYSLVLDSVFQLLYQDATWPLLMQALQHLYEGDTAGFLVTLDALGGPHPTVYRNSSEARTASNCLDTDNPTDPAQYVISAGEADGRTSYFGAIWSYISLPCAFWPVQDTDRYRGPWNTPTSATLLLISRRFDPATPHGGAVLASQTLAHARLLTIDGWGHGYYLAGKSTCADDAAAAYVIDGRLPAEGTVCPEDAPPFGDQPAATARAVAGQSEFAGLVDIGGGRRLYLECQGTGSPTVVLEAGASARADYWSRDRTDPASGRQMVMPAVARFTRVCAYDRPGTVFDPVHPERDPLGIEYYPSRSDPVFAARTAPEVLADFRALLQAAAIPGPYVLVGHSIGGALMRLYAGAHPEAVVGMVLVDSTPEDVWVKFEEAMTPAQWAAFARLQFSLEPNPDYPAFERLDALDVVAQVRETRVAAPLRPMPLAVLAHGVPFDAPTADWPTDVTEAIMLDQQRYLATLVPNARFSIAGTSGHNIHQDQPELVIEAIRQVVAGVRHPDTWDDLVACCTP